MLRKARKKLEDLLRRFPNLKMSLSKEELKLTYNKENLVHVLIPLFLVLNTLFVLFKILNP